MESGGRGQTGQGYAIGPWQGDRTTLTAIAPTPAETLAAALAGVLAAYRDEDGGTTSADEATIALPLRAEASDRAGLFVGLAAALFDEIDHDAYDVHAVQFDGLVRTDEGVTGWGYALAVPGEGKRTPLTVEETTVTEEAGTVRLRATLRRER